MRDQGGVRVQIQNKKYVGTYFDTFCHHQAFNLVSSIHLCYFLKTCMFRSTAFFTRLVIKIKHLKEILDQVFRGEKPLNRIDQKLDHFEKSNGLQRK